MIKRTLSYIVLSDIHLGHQRNKTANIIKNLREFFKQYNSLIKRCGVIFLAGDTFDRLLLNSSPELIKSTEWLLELVLYCKKHSIKLRILEGTPSHDWEQLKMLTTMIEKMDVDIDYQYINTLHIEIMQDTGMSILYVPDEYKPTAIETYQEVLKLLVEKDLTKVDIAIMHGAFHHQLPMVELPSSHNEDDYQSIVNAYIHIGHIHTPSVYGSILAQGSFDRLTHGEEGDKGGVLVTLSPHEQSFKILKNVNALVFKTLDYRGYKYNEVIDKFPIDITTIPKESHIRLLVDSDTALVKAVKAFKTKYIDFNIKIETKAPSGSTELNLTHVVDDTSFSITPDNIIKLLKDEMSKHELTSDEYELYDEEMKLVLEYI